jgi:hypothetical protein
METICEAFWKKWAKVPLLETYRQMAIRVASWEVVYEFRVAERGVVT